jgi:hypothetical protein
MRPLERLVALSLAALVFAPRAALACSVCSAGREDETQAAFIGTTALLSVLPLALIGGFLWWVRRRSRELAEGAPRRSRDLAA